MKVTAQAERSGAWWAVVVPEVDGAFTQAKRLDQIHDQVTDVVHLVGDVPQDEIEVDLVVTLEPDQQAALDEAVALSAAAKEAQERASVAVRTTAARLRTDGLAVRDVAALLGVSPQRVSQLLASTAAPEEQRAAS